MPTITAPNGQIVTLARNEANAALGEMVCFPFKYMLYSVDDKTYDAFFQAVLCGVNPLSGASGKHPQDEAKAILPGIAKL